MSLAAEGEDDAERCLGPAGSRRSSSEHLGGHGTQILPALGRRWTVSARIRLSWPAIACLGAFTAGHIGLLIGFGLVVADPATGMGAAVFRRAVVRFFEVPWFWPGFLTLPVHECLNGVSSTPPCLLWRRFGHILLVQTRAFLSRARQEAKPIRGKFDLQFALGCEKNGTRISILLKGAPTPCRFSEARPWRALAFLGGHSRI